LQSKGGFSISKNSAIVSWIAADWWLMALQKDTEAAIEAMVASTRRPTRKLFAFSQKERMPFLLKLEGGL
jgi:hypothetical protein